MSGGEVKKATLWGKKTLRGGEALAGAGRLGAEGTSFVNWRDKHVQRPMGLSQGQGEGGSSDGCVGAVSPPSLSCCSPEWGSQERWHQKEWELGDPRLRLGGE